LRRFAIAERELLGILVAQGLSADERTDAALGSNEELLRLTLTAPAGRVSLSHLKALTLKPPGLPKEATRGGPLQSLCEIAAHNVLNQSAESGELKAVSMRRLRDYVCRDLAALLNSASLDAVVDLTAYPHVQGSVLDFGMPSLAGRTARTVDAKQVA